MYSTTTDLQARFAPAFLKATADDNADNVPDTSIMEQAIADADARIDAVLAARYAVPFSPVPAEILELSCVLAGRNLARRVPNVSPDYYHADFVNAEEFLALLASGAASLPGVTPIAREISDTREDNERCFSRAKTDEF